MKQSKMKRKKVKIEENRGKKYVKGKDLAVNGGKKRWKRENEENEEKKSCKMRKASVGVRKRREKVWKKRKRLKEISQEK